MNLLIFKDDRVAINVESIDGVAASKSNSEHSAIFVNGSNDPFTVSYPFEEVVTMICNEGLSI